MLSHSNGKTLRKELDWQKKRLARLKQTETLPDAWPKIEGIIKGLNFAISKLNFN